MSPAASAQTIIRVMSQLASRQSSLCVSALAGAEKFEEWRHYPVNDAVDRRHGTEFYYHAHAANERLADEHGHFHVFARTHQASRFHHLVAISLNPHGLPTRLFLTNQWVTGESWVGVDRVVPLVERFDCQLSGRLAPVAKWITAMIHIYMKEILALHQQRQNWAVRDAGSASHQRKRLRDTRYGVVAQKKINLPQRLVMLGVGT